MMIILMMIDKKRCNEWLSFKFSHNPVHGTPDVWQYCKKMCCIFKILGNMLLCCPPGQFEDLYKDVLHIWQYAPPAFVFLPGQFGDITWDSWQYAFVLHFQDFGQCDFVVPPRAICRYKNVLHFLHRQSLASLASGCQLPHCLNQTLRPKTVYNPVQQRVACCLAVVKH